MKKTDQWNKGGKHEISGDGSCEISSYKLAATDVCHERRNFPGYEYSTPGEALMKEVSCEGTTETRGKKGMNEAIKHDSRHLDRKYG